MISPLPPPKKKCILLLSFQQKKSTSGKKQKETPLLVGGFKPPIWNICANRQIGENKEEKFGEMKFPHVAFIQSTNQTSLIQSTTSWWFQPVWKILYSQNGNLPQIGVNIKKYLKPGLGLRAPALWHLPTSRWWKSARPVYVEDVERCSDSSLTLPKTNIGPENRPSQKETSLPTTIFQVLC